MHKFFKVYNGLISIIFLYLTYDSSAKFSFSRYLVKRKFNISFLHFFHLGVCECQKSFSAVCWFKFLFNSSSRSGCKFLAGAQHLPLAIILKFGREEARFFNSHKLFIFFFRPWCKLLLQLSNLEITIFCSFPGRWFGVLRCASLFFRYALSLRANKRANIFPRQRRYINW